MYGTNNLPDSSNMCHETTSVALKKTIGVGVGTVVYDDLSKCDAMFFFGQNTGSNSPRFLHPLEAAAKRGVPIITFNPVREKGLEVFVNPQNPLGMLTGRETKISAQYHQVRPGGDIAVLVGLCKHVFAADDAAQLEGKRVLDVDFIDQNTHGFAAFEAKVRSTSWEEIEAQSGLSRQAIEEAAQVYVEAERVIGIYGMGLTQHMHGFENVAMFVNLLLLRGHIGREGAGISPVRGHSNVQGQRTVGITEKPELAPLDKISEQFGFEPPRTKGMNTVEACEGLLAGNVRAFIGLGGNFVRAIPEREKLEAAWTTMRLTVQIATKLNRSHLINGEVAYLLPCLGRTEEDIQATGPQAVSMEDTFSCIQGSIGRRKPASEHLMSEAAIVAGLAKATLPPNPKADMGRLDRRLRPDPRPDRGDLPRRVPRFQRAHVDPGRLLPGERGARADLEDRERQGRVHHPGPPVGERVRRRAQPLPADHDAQQRSVQHDDLRLQRPAARDRGHARRPPDQSGGDAARGPQRRPDGVADRRRGRRRRATGRWPHGHALRAAGRLPRRLLPGAQSADPAVEPRPEVEDAGVEIRAGADSSVETGPPGLVVAASTAVGGALLSNRSAAAGMLANLGAGALDTRRS